MFVVECLSEGKVRSLIDMTDHSSTAILPVKYCTPCRGTVQAAARLMIANWLSHKVVVTNDEYSHISISQIATQLRDHTSTILNIWTLDPDLDDPHSRTAIPECHYAN